MRLIFPVLLACGFILSSGCGSGSGDSGGNTGGAAVGGQPGSGASASGGALGGGGGSTGGDAGSLNGGSASGGVSSGGAGGSAAGGGASGGAASGGGLGGGGAPPNGTGGTANPFDGYPGWVKGCFNSRADLCTSCLSPECIVCAFGTDQDIEETGVSCDEPVSEYQRYCSCGFGCESGNGGICRY
jgi:hypothetical protein